MPSCFSTICTVLSQINSTVSLRYCLALNCYINQIGNGKNVYNSTHKNVPLKNIKIQNKLQRAEQFSYDISISAEIH